MSKVILTKDGFVTEDWQDGEWVRGELGDPIRCLRDSFKIEGECTLGDLFRAVDPHIELKRFLERYSWCHDIDAFHAEALLPRSREDEDDITYLEICRWVIIESGFDDVAFADWRKSALARKLDLDLEHEEAMRDNTPEFTSDVDFSGMGVDKRAWGVGCCPMNDLAHLPLRLREVARVYREGWKNGKPYHRSLGSGKDTFTFLEALDAVYWEISFYGGPWSRDEMVDDLHEMVDEIESGEANLTPLDI